MAKYFDQQAAADKEARRQVRVAYKCGNTVPYSLGRLLELGISLTVIKAVHRPTIKTQEPTNG